MEENISGKKKFENYREQFKRLNRAMINGFNLEAMFIEYAIIEDRTESVLRHAGLWEAYCKTRKGRESTLHSKVIYIQKCAGNKKRLLERYFVDELLDNILSWKDERNRMIHALLKQELEHNEISGIAERGNELVKTLRNRSGSYNRAIDKLNMSDNTKKETT